MREAFARRERSRARPGRKSSSGESLCRSPDEGGLLPNTSSDGVVENDDAVVAAGDGACVNDRMLHYHQHQHQQHPHQLQQQQQHPELDDLLRFRDTEATTGQGQEEMVAQEMAQGYTQLLHSAAAVSAQETQEYISLEELQPRIHHQEHHRSVHDTCAQLYQQQHQQRQQQQRDYYNLSSVQV